MTAALQERDECQMVASRRPPFRIQNHTLATAFRSRPYPVQNASRGAKAAIQKSDDLAL